MIKKCVYCKQEYETANTGSNRVCPNCSKFQNKAALGCGILILIVVIIYIFGVINMNAPDKDNESDAKSFARLYVAKQMRIPESTKTEVSRIYKDGELWVISGHASSENIMGGRSIYEFTIKLRHVDTDPYWEVDNYIHSEPY